MKFWVPAMSTKTLEETSLCGVWENVLREEHLKHHRVLTLRVRNVASYSEAASSRVCCSSTTPLTSGSRERCFARTDSLAASPIPRCRLQVPSRRMALVCYHGNGSPGTGRCNHIDDRSVAYGQVLGASWALGNEECIHSLRSRRKLLVPTTVYQVPPAAQHSHARTTANHSAGFGHGSRASRSGGYQ